ncbi:MAG: NUDIX hydrolase [Candidatus Omnitrophica bacterium]|nr:NUDIX hydrolase [Candidatus Omnitrophota bacterium]
MRYRTARQVSSGGVILRQQRGRFQVCLIARRREGALVWGLPKGHVEPGEDPPATALREVREETGLVGELTAPLGSITYRFAVQDERVRYVKRVHFFLLRYREGDTAHHDDEVEQARWLPLDKALTLLSYENERKVLRNAMRHLNEVGG